MAIAIRGTLRVKTVTGRNGDFSVGILETEVAKFHIKDATLDQFRAGTYKGQFWISEIFHSSYVTSSGSIIFELRARTSAMQIDDEDTQIPPAAGLQESDPIDEQRMHSPQPQPPAKKRRVIRRVGQIHAEQPNGKQPTEASTTNESANEAPQPDPQLSEDLELFGAELSAKICSSDPIKLDPTVDRIVLRRQAARLIALGYEFKSQLQTWLHSQSQ